MPSHRLASLGNPGSKDTSCFFGFDGVEFLLKKERVFFFQGPALQAFGQCGGASMRTRFCKNYFFEGWICAKLREVPATWQHVSLLHRRLAYVDHFGKSRRASRKLD